MSSPELIVSSPTSAPSGSQFEPTEVWFRAARRAKRLAWASLVWMSMEGVIGLVSGVNAHSLGVITWSASSFVEALASLIVVWRFTGHRALSPTSEAQAQRWVAASFFLLAPYFVVEAIRKLIDGGAAGVNPLAIAITGSAIVVMPLLGRAKLRLGKQLGSGATSGEGIQNLMCAVSAATALVAMIGAGAGLAFLDPVAALAIAGIALKEGRDGWRGASSCCAPMPGLDLVSAREPGACEDDCCGGAARAH